MKQKKDKGSTKTTGTIRTDKSQLNMSTLLKKINVVNGGFQTFSLKAENTLLHNICAPFYSLDKLTLQPFEPFNNLKNIFPL